MMADMPVDKAAPVLAIDGPSGSGKGTISRLSAGRLGWRLSLAAARGTALKYRLLREQWSEPVDGGEASQLTAFPLSLASPVWSPDGRFIAFASDRDGSVKIYRKQADGSGNVELLTESTREEWLRWKETMSTRDDRLPPRPG